MTIFLSPYAYQRAAHSYSLQISSTLYPLPQGAGVHGHIRIDHFTTHNSPLFALPGAPDPRQRYQTAGDGDYDAAADASMKLRMMLRRLKFGMSVVLSSLAPVFGEVSLVRSHSVMALRS